MASIPSAQGAIIDLLQPADADNHFGLAHSTFRLLVENTADGVVVVDQEGTVLYANAAATEIFGRSREELMLVPLGRPIAADDATESTITRPDHTTADIELRVVQVGWSGRPALLANLRDVSAKRREDERQRQIHKLEALGRLAAGIAHDFRNLIMVVQAGVRIVRRKVRDGAQPEEIEKLLDEVSKRTANAEALTGQLLAFSRKQELKPSLVAVNDRIRSAASMLEQTLGSGVEISVELSDGVGSVEMDADQFDIALLNLAVNARDAMGCQGRLTIQTAVTAASASGAELVRITVTDTGSGMDEETLAKAGEPFFTSKPDGKGTGLGLSQVYGFVVQSGGHVRIESALGHGTSVHLLLPRAHNRQAG